MDPLSLPFIGAGFAGYANLVQQFNPLSIASRAKIAADKATASARRATIDNMYGRTITTMAPDPQFGERYQSDDVSGVGAGQQGKARTVSDLYAL